MSDSDLDQQVLPACETLILTATPTEKDKLKQVAKELQMTYEKVRSSAFKVHSLGTVSGNRIMTIHTEMGAFGAKGSAANALLAKSQTRATILIGLGMAFGIDRTRQKIGDVLVSTSLLTYDDCRVKRDETGAMIKDFPDRIYYRANPVILNHLKQEANRQKYEGVSFGSLLTGGCAIQCAAYRDGIVHQLTRMLPRLTRDPDETIIGGEMEGSGLLATCPKDDPGWVVVKGISDFADEERDDEIESTRELACENASRFLLTALQNFKPEEDVNPITSQ